MKIDRRYVHRRRRSPWPFFTFLVILAGGLFVLANRTNLIINPFLPVEPSPTPTRTALSYLAEAEDMYREGKLGAATEAYARVSVLEPKNDEALIWQARLLILQGRAAKAIELAERAVELNESAFNLGVLAMAHDWNGDYDEAMDTALKAVDKDPVLAEAHAFLAEVYADRNNWWMALQEGETAVKLNERSAIAQRNLGYVLERQGRAEEAIEAYNRAAEIEPHLGYIYVGAGSAYLALGDREKALEQFQKAVATNPDNPYNYDSLGWGSYQADDPDRAIAALKKALELDPTYGSAHAHLAVVYYTQLNWEAAVEHFTKATEYGMKDENTYYQLGLSYANLEDCTNALVWLNKSLEVDPEFQPAKDALRLCPNG